MQQCHLFLGTGLGVHHSVETAQLEAVCVPSVPTVHDIPKRQDHFQHFLELVAALQFIAGKEDVLDLWPRLGEPFVSGLDEVQGFQSLDVSGNAGKSDIIYYPPPPIPYLLPPILHLFLFHAMSATLDSMSIIIIPCLKTLCAIPQGNKLLLLYSCARMNPRFFGKGSGGRVADPLPKKQSYALLPEIVILG